MWGVVELQTNSAVKHWSLVRYKLMGYIEIRQRNICIRSMAILCVM